MKINLEEFNLRCAACKKYSKIEEYIDAVLFTGKIVCKYPKCKKTFELSIKLVDLEE